LRKTWYILYYMRRYTILPSILLCSFLSVSNPLDAQTNYRDAMRRLVVDLSAYAKKINPSFFVFTQNGNALLEAPLDTPLKQAYLRAIDGVGQESLRYGDPDFGRRTPTETTTYLLNILRFLNAQGKRVLTIDYCDRPNQISEILEKNRRENFVSFVANRRALDTIPSVPASWMNFSKNPVTNLAAVNNFLFLINPEGFSKSEAFLSALEKTDYDLVIMDAYFDGKPLSPQEVRQGGRKTNGARRLVFAYMSIGEAEDYRAYWQKNWSAAPPPWIESENPEWKGNYRIRYWDPDWRNILFGSPQAYLDQIIAAGYDGVYLDTIDTFYYFEDQGH